MNISVDSPASSSTPGSDLPVRTACNHCRSKKIRCDKVSVEKGGCSRCKKENIQCNYDVRDPIGRPKKRKTEEESASASPPNTPSHFHRDQPSRRKARATSRRSVEGESPIDHDKLLQASQDSNLAAWPGNISSWPPSRSNPVSHSSPNETSTAIDSMSATTSASSFGRSSSTSVETTRQIDEAPTLSDLGLAAFLESLDTLEINTEDGLTPTMLEGLHGSGSVSAGGSRGGAAMANLDPTLFGELATPSQLSFSSLMNVQSSTSYAVPADLSWADPSWLLNTNTNNTARNGHLSSSVTEGARLSHTIPTSRSQAPSMTIIAPPMKEEVKIKEEGPCPKTGKAACCCGESKEGVNATSAPISAASPSPPASRVHCVPNPTGMGCTCLCDVSVALISVRATLRQARDQTQVQEQEGNAKKAAASTLQLTLSASQAVAAQCACSASCPTCRSDPSTSLSASLLVSTALQIYVRAVRTLRQGFGAAHESNGGLTTSSERGTGSEWDVSIGEYKPKPNNAKRIALFAMKLELRDLRDAIAKVSSAASASGEVDEPNLTLGFETINGPEGKRSNSGIMDGVNPIDQVVIRKLHQQLGDLLSTVEGIEQQMDAERSVV